MARTPRGEPPPRPSFLTGIDDPGQAAECADPALPDGGRHARGDEGAHCARLARPAAPVRAVGDGRRHERRRRPVHGRLGLGRPGRACRSWGASAAGRLTYAAMSVRVPTTLAGALTIDEFRDYRGAL